jgi:transmembrane sensor
MIEAAAAAWLSLRDRGMSPAETTEFVRWLQQDPQHAAIFAELDAVWKDFDRLGAVPAPSPTLTVGSAPDADLLAPRARARHHRTLAWTATALGAAAAVALLLFSLAHLRTPRHAAETAVGAFQKLDLPDGSVAQLNTDSALDTAFTPTERRVRIVRGEVFFNVTKDPARPFIVTSGAVAVRAVGTAFNVRQRAEAVEVLVTEGRVRVDDTRAGRSLLPADSAATTAEPPLLSAGDFAVVPSTATAATPAKVERLSAPATQRALAWQERRLEFDAVPLAEVVAEFNRYNRQQLVIADPALAAKRFSGTFRADGYESLVRLLEENFAVTATRNDRAIVLHARR